MPSLLRLRKLLTLASVAVWSILQALQLTTPFDDLPHRSFLSLSESAQASQEAQSSLDIEQIGGSQHALKSNGAPIFPEECNELQKRIVRYQLPPKRCQLTAHRPYENRCSFSYASRCPDSLWLTKIFDSPKMDRSKESTAVYVGCNKGMDAVNTLRMVTANEIFDKNQWRETLLSSSRQSNLTVHAGHCSQEYSEQYSIPKMQNPGPATVHCIEAMPNSYYHLNRSIYALNWKDSLKVHNYAVSDTDGSVLFPNRQAGNAIGVESLGIETCTVKGQRRFCSSVKQRKLDTFVQSNIQSDQYIDILSIDVEGFDCSVLKGAKNTLPRVKYLEFEYNWKGAWKDQQLSDSIHELKKAGFVCYWAGTNGNIWRITNCWQSYFDLKFWSNIACVNLQLNRRLAEEMEIMFQNTIQAQDKIRYHNASSVDTDGRLNWDFKGKQPIL